MLSTQQSVANLDFFCSPKTRTFYDTTKSKKDKEKKPQHFRMGIMYASKMTIISDTFKVKKVLLEAVHFQPVQI